MEKQEKVMEGLRACGIGVDCGEQCPYEAMHADLGAGNCIVELCRDALELIKAQAKEITSLKHHVDCTGAEKTPWDMGVVSTTMNHARHASIVRSKRLTERNEVGMDRKEKVREGVRACSNGVECGGCPYVSKENCIEELRRDALEVIWMEMTMNPADSVLERAVKTYGEESQLWMVIEEMSELAKEICKYKRGMNNPETMAEEIADVQIMLEQAKIIFGNSRRVNEMIEYKLNRLERRLDEVKGNDAGREAESGAGGSGQR